MNKKQKGLGKGIDAILPYEAKFCEIAIADIETNPFQPRINFDGEAINELAESIKSPSTFGKVIITTLETIKTSIPIENVILKCFTN